jgi:exonuclease SbcC
MRLEHLILRGFTHAFPGVVDLPLHELEPGLHAVLGPNGHGKTTLIEAMAPAPLYRQLPARNGADPVDYATGRDSFLELQFATETEHFRARVNLDGPKRSSDAVLEIVLADGTRAALNDGKRSTFDEQIKKRFPSFDLFINSAFAAQGRGDEFTRRKPSQRKDLFAEFLSIGHLLEMGKTAAEAAELTADARLRLEARIEAIERDCAPAVLQELDRLANELQQQGGDAETRQPAIKQQIASLEGRIAVLKDSTAAYAAATLRVQDLERQLRERKDEQTASKQARIKYNIDAKAELDTIERKKIEAVADITSRIAGNKQIQDKGDEIRAAVATLPPLEQQLAVARETQQTSQRRWTELSRERLAAGNKVNAFTGPQKDLDHAKTSAALLKDVPCGGAGEFSACKFLVNAKAAEDRIDALEQQLAGLQAAIAARDGLDQQLQALDGENKQTATTISRLEGELTAARKTADYEKALIDSDARLAELRTKQADVETAAGQDAEAARTRHHQRTLQFDAADLQLAQTISRLETDVQDAKNDVDLASGKASQFTTLQTELAAARAAWDDVTAILASVASRRQELERRREVVKGKQAQLTDLQELVEWRDLAKALGKGGLPDLEIDAAGPSITALTNDLLTSCFGPRFTIELVTQVAEGGRRA